MHPTPTHPSWCEYPDAPNDSTHTHTAAIGTVCLAGDTTVELVLVQTPDSLQPMLTLHVTTPSARLSIDMTGVQAWAPAGSLIDATVAHAQAASSRRRAVAAPPDAPLPPPGATGRARPMWLLDRHPNGRMSPRRTGRSGFRCPPTRPGPSGDDCDRGDDELGG